MRVLYITNDLHEKNGWSTYTTNLIRVAVRDRENSVAVLAHDVDGYIHTRLRTYTMNFQPHDLIWNPFYMYVQYRQYRQIILDFKPDIIHVVVESLSTPLGLCQIKVPFIMSVHGTYADLSNTLESSIKKCLCNFFYKRALRNARSVICVSDATKKKITSAIPFIEDKVCVVHNSVFIEVSSQESQDIPRSEPLHVVTVGEIKKRKGIHETIVYLAHWAHQNKRVVVYDVVGSNNQESSYMKTLNDLLKTHTSKYFSTVFHGQVSDEQKRQILSRASMYAHLERVDNKDKDVEGFGIGIIEANGYGLPAIVFEGSATVEAVRDGKTGYVLKKDESVESINTKLSTIFNGDVFLEKDLRGWVNEHSPEVIYEKIIRLYRCVK